jgi:hypothetical protein
MTGVVKCEWLHVQHGYYIESEYNELLHYIHLNTNTKMPALSHYHMLPLCGNCSIGPFQWRDDHGAPLSFMIMNAAQVYSVHVRQMSNCDTTHSPAGTPPTLSSDTGTCWSLEEYLMDGSTDCTIT